MSELWKIIQGHLDKTGVREAEFARRIGTNPTTVNSWKNRGVRNLPERRLLESVARVTGVGYHAVLSAVLVDIDYISDVPTLIEKGGHDGVWGIGADMMVRLAMEAKRVEHDAWSTVTYLDDGEIGSLAADLARSAEKLARTAEEVAEIGMGGALRLQEAVDDEHQRRVREMSVRARRHSRAYRTGFRNGMGVGKDGVDPTRPTRDDLPAAARRTGGRSPEQAARDAQDEAAEQGDE